MPSSNDSPAVRLLYKRIAPSAYELARPVLSTVTSVKIRKTSVFPRHQHLNYQIILVESGRYRCKVNDQELLLGRDEILVVKPGDSHEDFCQPPLRYFSVNFDLKGTENEKVMDVLFRSNVTPEEQVLRGKHPKIWEVVRSMRAEGQCDDDVVPKIENALLLEFFWRLIRALPKERISPRFLSQSEAHAFSTRLMQIFDTHRADRLEVDVMAREMGISKRTLTQRCRIILRQSPAHAYMAHKIQYAASLISQTGKPIKEISQMLGFQNPYHFSRVFKRFHGRAPSASRELPK